VSEDAQVGWEVGEHGAGFAGFEVEDELAVHFLGVHGVEGVEELIGVEEFVNDGNKAGSSVISEVNEDVVSRGTLEDLLSASGSGVTSEDTEEVLGVDIGTFVVNNAASVDVVTVWLVENFSWERIFRVVGDIVEGHGDNVVWVDTVCDESLISVANIGLVAIVIVVVGTGQQDGVDVS